MISIFTRTARGPLTILYNSIVTYRGTKPMSNEPQTLTETEDSPDSSWHCSAVDAVFRLGGLTANWDGYGSPPIKQAALRKALALLDGIQNYDLPTPEICPVTGGGIGIAWHQQTHELEVEILPDGSAEFVIVERENKEEKTTEGTLPPDPISTMQRLATQFING
jgi:hypothetical protein